MISADSEEKLENFVDASKEEFAKEIEKKVLLDEFRRKKESDSNSSEGYDGSNSSSDDTLTAAQESEQCIGDQNGMNPTVNRFNNNNELIEKRKTGAQSYQKYCETRIEPIAKSKRTRNWGEDVGIYDQNGETKRVVSLSELRNYFEFRLKASNGFKFYFSLIDSRYPRLFKLSVNGSERWRMRYNIFADGLFGKCDEQFVLHVGEVMVYFDVTKTYFYPYYVNCSYYGNYCPINKEIQNSSFRRMISTIKYVLTSNNILQLKFPMSETKFRNRNQLYNEFAKNQNQLINATVNMCANTLLSGKRLIINSLAKRLQYRSIDRKSGPNYALALDKRMHANKNFNTTDRYRNSRSDAFANTTYYQTRSYQNSGRSLYSDDESKNYRHRGRYSERNDEKHGYDGSKNYYRQEMSRNHRNDKHKPISFNAQKKGDIRESRNGWKTYGFDNNSTKYGTNEYKGYSKPNNRSIYY